MGAIDKQNYENSRQRRKRIAKEFNMANIEVEAMREDDARFPKPNRHSRHKGASIMPVVAMALSINPRILRGM